MCLKNKNKKHKNEGKMDVTITSAALAKQSLEPASLYEKLLSYSVDRSCKLDSSSGSDLLVSNFYQEYCGP